MCNQRRKSGCLLSNFLSYKAGPKTRTRTKSMPIMKKLLFALRYPLLVEFINYVVYSILCDRSLQKISLLEILTNVVTVGVVFAAGWLAYKAFGTLGKSAIAGVTTSFFSTVVLGGGGVFLKPMYVSGATFRESMETFVLALGLFVLLIPVSVLIAAAGGWVSKKQRNGATQK